MRGVFDFSNQGLKQIPEPSGRDTAQSLDVSKNKIKELKNVEFFLNIRYLNISQNRITDLSPLVTCTKLVELDCSKNLIKKLDPICNLPKLVTLRASNNDLSEIAKPLPRTLTTVDISNNNFTNFEFLQDKLSDELINLDISGNGIEEICSLRFVAVFQKLLTLNVGILKQNKGLKIIQFAKHLCPMLETFDGENCADVDSEDFFNTDALIEVLVNGSESELRTMLSNAVGDVTWDEPEFVPFEADLPMTPLKNIDERLKKLEEKIPDDEDIGTPKRKDDKPITREEFNQIRSEISELREQVVKLSELLYVHDCAMKHLWESQ